MSSNTVSGTGACLFAMLAAALALGGCDWTKPKVPGAEERSAKEKLATARRLKQACGSAQTYDRLKALTFDEVGKVQSGASRTLDAVAANATLRMQDPIAKSRDEQLDITVCQGHMVLDLPPGLRDAFNGDPQLEADVEYSAQAAADGSGLVYQMKGAEPIIYRLAALTLPKGSAQLAAAVPPSAAASPVASAPAASTPPAAPTPAPASTVAAAAPVRPPVSARPAPPPAPAPAREVVRRPAVPPPAAPPRPAPLPAALQPAPNYAAGAARPSFSCGRVTSRVLRMVCADPGLATRDRRMSSAFYAALADGDESQRAALRESRDRFLAFRNRCGTPACVAQAYDDRMAEIGDIARGE